MADIETISESVSGLPNGDPWALPAVVMLDGRPALLARIAEYERRYGISSGDLGDAIDRGELEETFEITRWLIDYDLLASVAEE